MRLRRRHPEATPTDVVQVLERHYATSITAAGAVITAGAIAADIGIAMIPGVGAAAAGAKSAGQRWARRRRAVYGLSNERASQQQITATAADLAPSSSEGVVDVGHRSAASRADWTHWADTLADSLPAGGAQELVRTIQTGQLDTVRTNLSGKQQSAIEYGVGAVAGSVARFVFGREVVDAARIAFGAAPNEFPAHEQAAEAREN